MSTKNKNIIILANKEYVSISMAAEMLHITPQVFCSKLAILEENGLCVYRTCSNNKGTKVCKADIDEIKDKALKTGTPITKIKIGKHNESSR